MDYLPEDLHRDILSFQDFNEQLIYSLSSKEAKNAYDKLQSESEYWLKMIQENLVLDVSFLRDKDAKTLEKVYTVLNLVSGETIPTVINLIPEMLLLIDHFLSLKDDLTRDETKFNLCNDIIGIFVVNAIRGPRILVDSLIDKLPEILTNFLSNIGYHICCELYRRNEIPLITTYFKKIMEADVLNIVDPIVFFTDNLPYESFAKAYHYCQIQKDLGIEKAHFPSKGLDYQKVISLFKSKDFDDERDFVEFYNYLFLANIKPNYAAFYSSFVKSVIREKSKLTSIRLVSLFVFLKEYDRQSLKTYMEYNPDARKQLERIYGLSGLKSDFKFELGPRFLFENSEL